MVKLMAAAALAVALVAGTPAVGHVETEDPHDYDIPAGHFYTQTNGASPGASTRGFSISDEFGVPFWTEFRHLGGVERLGYPISQRFVWHGLISQATQKGVLQWAPATGKVQLVNVLDYLADHGKEQWLQQEFLVPPTARGADAVAADPGAVVQWLAEQKNDTLPFRLHYVTAPDPWKLFGRPTAPPRDLGDLVAMRFQRTVLQLWRVSGPGIAQGAVTSLNVGDIFKASGILPAEVLAPQEAPPPELRAEARLRSRASRDPGGPARGLATWYGGAFHGQRMANGEIYDAGNPTTAAANIFPLGAWLRVIDLATGAAVEVRVTDRGAFRYPIVVDLSWGAFRKLADPRRGVVNVLVQPLHRE